MVIWTQYSDGLQNDRIFLVIDPETGAQRTMRELSSMTLIVPKINGDDLVITAGDKTLTLPLAPEISKYEKRTVTVWNNSLEAADMGDEAAKFFSDFLQVPCRLVYKSPNHVRPVIEHAPGVKEIGFQPQTAFADCFPILCLSQESIDDINSHLDKPVTAANFRPNLVVSGVTRPWEEDTWCTANIRGVTYYFACRCTRCDMPNVDPATGIKDKIQPQKTLQSIRRVDKGKKAKYYACVGINVVPNAQSGLIRAGDALEIKEVFQGERKRTGDTFWSTKEVEVEA